MARCLQLQTQHCPRVPVDSFCSARSVRRLPCCTDGLQPWAASGLPEARQAGVCASAPCAPQRGGRPCGSQLRPGRAAAIAAALQVLVNVAGRATSLLLAPGGYEAASPTGQGPSGMAVTPVQEICPGKSFLFPHNLISENCFFLPLDPSLIRVRHFATSVASVFMSSIQ